MNRFWRVLQGRPPSFSSFAAEATAQHRADYRGRAADIFFANPGEAVHKWLHFLPIYDRLFTPFIGKPVKFLEIGVFRGGSLRMWREFFGAEAVIFGIDIDPACAVHDGNFGRVRIGSQADPAFLRRVVEEMGGVDVVLDDGSHVASHQRVTYETLFPLLSEGGVYAIEDLHTAYWPKWEGGLRRPGTAIEFLKRKIDEMHAPYYKGGHNRPETMTDIESVQFFDSIAAVTKRQQAPRHHVLVPSLPKS